MDNNALESSGKPGNSSTTENFVMSSLGVVGPISSHLLIFENIANNDI